MSGLLGCIKGCLLVYGDFDYVWFECCVKIWWYNGRCWLFWILYWLFLNWDYCYGIVYFENIFMFEVWCFVIVCNDVWMVEVGCLCGLLGFVFVYW